MLALEHTLIARACEFSAAQPDVHISGTYSPIGTSLDLTLSTEPTDGMSAARNPRLFCDRGSLIGFDNNVQNRGDCQRAA